MSLLCDLLGDFKNTIVVSGFFSPYLASRLHRYISLIAR